MRFMWKSNITLGSTKCPYAVAQRFSASSKNSPFQSTSFPRSTGPLEIECHEYIESAAKHQVHFACDENDSTELSGVMSRLMEGIISSSDDVCSGSTGRAGSILLDEAESCIEEGYRFGGR